MKEKSASSTAYTVLQGLLHVSATKEHGYLVPEETAKAGRQIMEASSEGRERLRQIKKPWVKLSVRVRESLLLPGITVHYALRKRYVEDQTRKAISEGANQVVILGAGFDSLAWRLSKENPEIQFVEIDHPETQKPKANAFQQTSDGSSENLCLLSVDFTQQSLKEALEDCPDFLRARPTAYVCEGVLMYLDTPDIDKVFEAISQLSGDGSSLLFTAIEPQGSPTNNVRSLLYTYLKLVGEPIKWTARHEELEAFVLERGFELIEQAGTDELKRRYVTKPSNYTYHYGEHFTLCRFRKV